MFFLEWNNVTYQIGFNKSSEVCLILRTLNIIVQALGNITLFHI